MLAILNIDETTRLTAVDIAIWSAAIVAIYVAICLVLSKRKARPIWWCLPLALALTATYAVNLYDFADGTLYMGVSSDQSLNLAYTNNVLAGNYGGDYFDKRVPAHYSPLYFWVTGTIGRLLDWNAIDIWRYFPLLLLFGLPFLTFAIGRRLGGDRCGFYACFTLFALGSFHTMHYLGLFPFEYNPFQLHRYLLTKPHELIAAMLMVLWVVTLARGPDEDGPTTGWTIRQGLLGTAIALLYSPWAGLGLAAMSCCGLFGVPWTTRPRYWLRVTMVAGITALGSAVHWLPFAIALLRDGSDPTAGTDYFMSVHLDPSGVTIGMGHFGLLFFLGLAGFSKHREQPAARALLVAAALVYVWFFSTYLTYPLFEFAFLPHRCYLVLQVVLAFAAAIGLQQVHRLLSESGRERFVSCGKLAVAALFLLPILPRWNLQTDHALERAKAPIPQAIREMVTALDQLEQPTLVGYIGNDVPSIAALSQTRLYLATNLSFANPLARYQTCAADLRAAVDQSASGPAFADALARLGIDALLMHKTDTGAGRIDYYIRPRDPMPEERTQSFLLQVLNSFRVESDNKGPKRGSIDFAPRLFRSPRFKKAYENDDCILILRG